MFKARLSFPLLAMALLWSALTAAVEPEHALWDTLLKQHVINQHGGKATVVDYAGFKEHRNQLKDYLELLASVSTSDFDSLSKDAQLAFLINAYNAWTVELILTRYPDLESIKELGSFFRSPWKKAFIPLLGATRSLDDIEHKLIRGSDRYQEPRIHFAVNCASIGCPALRDEAYRAEVLNAQLEQQTQLFLADQTRNRLQKDHLAVSSIFKWYREDFEKGWLGYQSLDSFLLNYADALGLQAQHKQLLEQGKLKIKFLDYDWKLNDK